MAKNEGINGPLSGIVCLDLTRILAGPFCTRILADLGALVIKIEPPGGDPTRAFGSRLIGKEPEGRDVNSSYFANVNAGKRTITLDLKREKDMGILLKLISKADVLVENFRPGVMKRLGLDWPTLHRKHPSLIMASISGFGQNGPKAHLKAMDSIIQASSGIMSVTSTENGGIPTRCGVSISDVMAGIFAANGIQAALLGRQRSTDYGGSYVDISMLDASVAAASVQLSSYGASGNIPVPIGNKNPVVSPFDSFRCSDEKYVMVTSGTDMFEKLCHAIERPHLAKDPRFRSNYSRLQNNNALSLALENAFRQRPAHEWVALLQSREIPVAIVASIDDVARDEQVEARRMAIRTIDSKWLCAGNPIKIDRWPDTNLKSRPNPPRLDEDRESILRFAEKGRSKL